MTRNKLFNYFGAKTRFVDQIYRNLHPNFRNMKYCSVFGGSGIDLYYKPRSIVEIYNDIDSELSSIFWCLINEYDELIKRLKYCVQSEHIFNWFKEFVPKTKLDKAIMGIYRCHFSLMNTDRFWKQKKLISTKGRTREIYNNQLFKKWRERFQNVQIYSEDFRKFIKSLDEEENFFYMDPPYIKSTKSKEGYYLHNFSMKDHDDLFEILSNCQSKWLLSYDNDDYILNKYSDFNIKQIKVHYTSSSKNKHSNNTELLISNYPFPKNNPLIRKHTISLMRFMS